MYRQKTQKENNLDMHRLKGFICAVFLLFGVLVTAQNNSIDSLEDKLSELKLKPNFSKTDTIYINLLNNLANAQRFYKSDSLLLLANQALKLSKESNYKSGESNALLGLGDYHSDKGQHNKAIEYFQKALETSQLSLNSALLLEAQNSLAVEYSYKGDYTNSLKFYLAGIDLAKETNSDIQLSAMSENVAHLYISQKDYDQALEFYEEVLKINERIGDDVVSAESMSNIASLYADINNLDHAMFNVNSSIKAFEEHKVMDWLAYAYEIKGKIYLKENKYKWALHWYNQSEMLHQNLDDERGKIDLYNGMAEAYLGLENDSLSEKYALKANAISHQIKFMEGKKKCALTLYKLHKKKNNFEEALKYHEIYQTLLDTLSRNENKASLNMLKTKMEHERQKIELIEKNKKELASQQTYVYLSLAILVIFLAVTLLMRRGERIQRSLYQELQNKTKDLEKRELELRKINETKDRLFSIIGHDLRGPIGAFQSLLKYLKDGDIGQAEFMGFIPKLRHDIDHISFTLNNLLSWGQSQMNGLITKPTSVDLQTIVNENLHLLSETADNKSIRLISHLNPNTTAWTDANQIDIVIRNLISNALKFTPENGMVTISSMEKNDQWQISIRDTGVGMSQEVINKLFSKNSNVTTYGTNNEKGTGLGLSLCKEMVEENNGKIWVNSKERKGSTFHFTVPKSKTTYKKTA